MQQPADTYDKVIEMLKYILVPAGIFGTIWKAINEIAKYFAEKRRDEIKAIMTELVNPQMEALTKSIEKLGVEIAFLKVRRNAN